MLAPPGSKLDTVSRFYHRLPTQRGVQWLRIHAAFEAEGMRANSSWAARTVITRSVLSSIVALVACSTASIAEEREWSTTRAISNGEQVKLNWVGVYEGRDTVYKITFAERRMAPGELKVVGQPVFSPSSRYAAFPYCADDGCQEKVSVVDLENRSVIKTITLPYQGQIYVSCVWAGDTLEISVNVPTASSPNGETHSHRYSFAGST